MADPFEQLRVPHEPVAPDPAFGARLRDRLERLLALPEGVTVSDLTLEDQAARSDAAGAPTARAALTPYLAVAGAREAIDWYGRALGAEVRGEPIVMPDGRIGHAELEIGGALLMLSDEYPQIGVVAPTPGGGANVTLHLDVADVDAVVAGAVEAGATLERAAADHDYGRNAVVRDPFGHRWLVSGAPLTAAAPGPRHGDMGYVSLWVPDVERAATFFATVLGWRYQPGGTAQSRLVDGLTLPHGLAAPTTAAEPWAGRQPRSTLFCCYAVDDVDAAVARVRAAGGAAAEPHEEPYGRIAECADDQGVAFAVFEPPGGAQPSGRAAPGAPNGARQGDLAYVTMEVVDSARTRAFYGAVLGWRFSPGRVPDGWTVEGVFPMTGLHGGHAEATTIPMYRVDDVAGAVERVRQAGGSATEPEEQPYGITALCSDDQGTRFYLGQL